MHRVDYIRDAQVCNIEVVDHVVDKSHPRDIVSTE